MNGRRTASAYLFRLAKAFPNFSDQVQSTLFSLFFPLKANLPTEVGVRHVLAKLPASSLHVRAFPK